MATTTRTREEIDETTQQSTSYPVYVVTPNSSNIQRVIDRSRQAEATENTPLYFPERGRPLGRNPRNRSMSLSPTRLRAARLSALGTNPAPEEPECSLRHQYYTRESAGIPIRPESHQRDLHTELQDQIDTSDHRSMKSPHRSPISLHSSDRQTLTDLQESIQEVPRTPTHMLFQRISPVFQTPETPSVFNQVTQQPELLTEDRISEVVVYPQEQEVELTRSLFHNIQGQGPFRENFTFSNTSIHHSTPRNNNTSANRPQTYSEQYRSIMNESPYAPGVITPLSSPREPLNVTQSDFPELRDRDGYRRSRDQLHATAHLIRDLLVRLGINNQTDRTAVGWLRVLETLATTPLSNMPINLANNIREPRNAGLLNHYVHIIRGQPYRDIVENSDWLSIIPNLSSRPPTHDESPRQRILRLRANLEMLTPEPVVSGTSSDDGRRRNQLDEAMQLGFGNLTSRARALLLRVGFALNLNRTPIGWLRALREVANVNDDTFTPELSQVFQGDNIDQILTLERESNRPEFNVILDNSLYPSELIPPTPSDNPRQGGISNSSSGSDTPYQMLDGQWLNLPQVRENSLTSAEGQTQRSSPTYVETPQNPAQQDDSEGHPLGTQTTHHT
ncbi:hypothetical protein BDP27DRAFT_1436651 [Rhodocollybia butyracea]|uniref:Uncharacterized protein n=1 Tax=Rhodocollybia butyracea TaxID=206335 RepID=A0A9P5P4I9_9AGAR|nr:hypothetical protein BDP27DRAFT_1436651 [Rhodocollybia butyracea]